MWCLVVKQIIVRSNAVNQSISRLTSDKLVLLFEETKNENIAIKTLIGITNRTNIENIIMQGTVFGSNICSAVMDKLAKIFYNNKVAGGHKS